MIAINGKKGSGKDTVGNMLLKYFKGAEVKKFATKPVLEYYNKTGINFHNLGREEKEKVRPDFIKFSQGIKQERGEDVWVRALFEEEGDFIITDLRLEVEYNYLKEKGYTLIRIERDLDDTLDYSDVTETELDNFEFDYIIDNNVSLDELEEIVRNVANEIHKRRPI